MEIARKHSVPQKKQPESGIGSPCEQISPIAGQNPADGRGPPSGLCIESLNFRVKNNLINPI